MNKDASTGMATRGEVWEEDKLQYNAAWAAGFKPRRKSNTGGSRWYVFRRRVMLSSDEERRADTEGAEELETFVRKVRQ